MSVFLGCQLEIFAGKHLRDGRTPYGCSTVRATTSSCMLGERELDIMNSCKWAHIAQTGTLRVDETLGGYLTVKHVVKQLFIIINQQMTNKIRI